MAINFDHQRDRITTHSNLVKLNINGAVTLPVGDATDRPAIPEFGQLRYNSESNAFEGYDIDGSWGIIDGVRDYDKDTYIKAENPDEADNDQLDFYTAGNHVLRLDTDGDFKFGDGLNKFTIDWATGDTFIAGTLNVQGQLIAGAIDVEVDGGSF